jgi:hypothetical protein
MATSLVEITSGEESIVHFGGVRIRATGNANLKLNIRSLDSIQSLDLVPMAITPGREKFRLSNFVSQRAFLTIKTTEINETFEINRVIAFVKPIYTDYPNGGD